MSGIFEELEMFDEGDKVVTRQAIAAATKRLNDNFGGFLRQASTKKEFESRLALVDTDINNMVADVVTEYGGDAEKIASAVKETVKTAFTPTTPSADESCSNCGGHGCDKCTNDPEASKTASEDRPEHLKAQDEVQLADEHSQVNPWLKKQIQDEDQEDGGNLRNKEANIEDSQPVSNPVPLAKTEGYGGNIEEQLEKAPSAVGTGHEAGLADAGDWIGEKASDALGAAEAAGRAVRDKTLDAGDWIGEKASDALGGAEAFADKTVDALHAPKDKFDQWRGASSAAHTVKEKGDKFVVIEDGGKEAAGPFNSKEKAQARAKELNELENLEKEAGHKTASTCPECNEQSYPDGYGCLNPKCEADTNEASGRREILHHAVDNYGTPVLKGGANGPFHYDPEAAKNNTNLDYALPEYEKEIAQMRSQNPGMGMTTEQDLRTTSVMDRALALKEAAAQGKKRNFFAAKPETGDSTEENESLPTGNEDAHDGPSPKMDKKKWIPNATNPNGNLKPIETEGEHSPHPTRKMDIKEKPDYQNDDPWEHDNNVWEREQLPTATKDEAGFEGTRNIDQPTKAAETFPDKGQTNPVTREALAGNERVAIFEDERDILEENVPEDYSPSREGIMSELADLKQRLIENGSSPEEAEAEIKDLVMGMWRTEQSPEELGEIGIEDVRSENDEIPAEDVELDTELTPEGTSLPSKHDFDTELSPENASVPVDREIEEIIERGDDDGDRVEVIHEEDEDKDEDPLGFDDPEKLDEEEDEDLDIPFDEELSNEELDRLLKKEEKEEYDDEDLFL